MSSICTRQENMAVTTPAEIDASCRLPMFALMGGAALWLVLSSVLGLIASIKFHSPNFLAGSAWLSYGRVFPASANALVYGFAIPSGLGVGLWLLARLGRVPLAQPWLVAVAAKLWHIGVLVGLMGILGGDATGFEWLEMPQYAAVILFVAFLLIALHAIVTHHARRRASALYPSQWFVLAALFWFPWIYSTANLLLLVYPVRGVAQAAIQWWFSGNLLFVWLSLAGLGASFYFLPKLSGRPLQSHYLALFAFLTLILFGTWVGIPAGATLPAWMPTLSGVATVSTLVPLLTVAMIAVQTVRGTPGGVRCEGSGVRSPDTSHLAPEAPSGPLCYVKFGVSSFVLSGVMLAASALPEINRVTDFTWFGGAQNQLRIYGFFAMTMFGAVYYILPRAVGIEFPFAKFIRAHFWCGAIGTLLLALPLAIGGIVQGFKLVNPNVAFLDVTKSALMFLRLGTVGELLIALGNLLFLLNVLAVIVRYYRAICVKVYAAATVRLEPTTEGNAEARV